MTTTEIVALQAQLDSSIAARTATGVLVRVFKELDTLSEPEIVDDTWAQKLVDLYTFSQSVEIGFLHAKAYILAILRPHWDTLSFDFRKRYGYNFMTFAKLYTGGKEISTINNYINTAKTWFIDKVAPTRPVQVVVRQPDGRPVLENGKPKTMWVEFNPFNVDMSKLLIVTARAARREMTDRLWEMLVDPFYSCEDVRLEHVGVAPDGDSYSVVFFVEGPGLFASVNGETVCLADEMNWEHYEQDESITLALNYFLRTLHIKLDEEKIYEIQHRADAKGVSYEDIS